MVDAKRRKFMVQQLGGWKSRKMVERYAALQTQHLAPTVSLIDRVVSGAGTTVAQLPNFRDTLAS